MNQLSLWSDNDPAHSWVVRESRRARRLAVRVFRTGRVEVVVPPRTPRVAVEHFLEGHRDWIERKRTAALRVRLPEAPFPPPTVELSAAGESWRLHLAGGAGRLQLATYDHLLILSGAPAQQGEAGRRELRDKLLQWLTGRALSVFAQTLAAAAREHGFSYRKLTVRRQRTRWGSCSAQGTISLNCCLLFQTPEVLRYLIIHELAHTRHMNHSPRFWQCVAQCCPDYRRLDRQLLDGWRRVPSWVL